MCTFAKSNSGFPGTKWNNSCKKKRRKTQQSTYQTRHQECTPHGRRRIRVRLEHYYMFIYMYVPFWQVFIRRKFNTVISLSNFMSEVMLIWISMWAVPSFVPLHVIFTQNSTKRKNLVFSYVTKEIMAIKLIFS